MGQRGATLAWLACAGEMASGHQDTCEQVSWAATIRPGALRWEDVGKPVEGKAHKPLVAISSASNLAVAAAYVAATKLSSAYTGLPMPVTGPQLPPPVPSQAMCRSPGLL